MTRGKYVVIEGHDGTGKSTQVELLAEYLKKQGIETYVAHEPAGTPIADEIRTIIKNGELHRSAHTNLLLFTAARHEIWRHAERQLRKGVWIISARNYLSTLAYQGHGEGLDKELILDSTKRFIGESYMRPDHTIILTLDDEARTSRLKHRDDNSQKDTFESRADEFQTRVHEAYLHIAHEHGHHTIDASASIDDIHRQIIDLLAL